MSTKTRLSAAALGMAALLAGAAIAGQASAAPATAPNSTTTTTTATADSAVTSALTFSREEERMARDLYAALAKKYDGARPFSMITNSESRHFAAVGTLLDRYDVTDPSAGKAAGTYSIKAIQDLYDGWLAEGSASLEAAYRVGVELEQRDIADLKKSIAADLPADVDTVLGQLLKGSQNHLAAYQRAVDGDLGTGAGMMRGRAGADGTTPGRGNGMGNRNGNRAGNGNGMRNGTGNGPGTSGDCIYTDGTAS